MTSKSRIEELELELKNVKRSAMMQRVEMDKLLFDSMTQVETLTLSLEQVEIKNKKIFTETTNLTYICNNLKNKNIELEEIVKKSNTEITKLKSELLEVTFNWEKERKILGNKIMSNAIELKALKDQCNLYYNTLCYYNIRVTQREPFHGNSSIQRVSESHRVSESQRVTTTSILFGATHDDKKLTTDRVLTQSTSIIPSPATNTPNVGVASLGTPKVDTPKVDTPFQETSIVSSVSTSIHSEVTGKIGRYEFKIDSTGKYVAILSEGMGEIYGYCSDCEMVVLVKVSRRCNRCHSYEIEDAKDGNWTELNGQYNNMVHSRVSELQKSTKCENKRWEFTGTCYVHPDKKPDRHCPLLPGVISNKSNIKCGDCKQIEPILLRWECGHYLCIRKCWRLYLRTKLDNRELLFDIPRQGADATLICPSTADRTKIEPKCKHYVKSHNLFKVYGKTRYDQYQTLGMEHLVGRMLTPQSTDGEIDLKDLVITFPISKRCKLCSFEHRQSNNLNNRLPCQCRKDFCWHCENHWKPECGIYHLISQKI